MKFKIFNSFGKEVGILEIEKKLAIEKADDLLKEIISKLLKEGITYVFDSAMEKGKIKEILKTTKIFNRDNIGLLENFLLSKGYSMEGVTE